MVGVVGEVGGNYETIHGSKFKIHDFLGGVLSGVNGTPTFFINGHRHDGSFEFDDLIVGIEARLPG